MYVKTPIRMLFLCVANSARSQIAEALARKIFGATAIIESAGSNPSGEVHLMATQVLREEGVDSSGQFSKSIDRLEPEFLQNLDFIVTLCAEELCPVTTGSVGSALISKEAKRLHWPLPDPANSKTHEQVKAFRNVRDEIHAKLSDFKSHFHTL